MTSAAGAIQARRPGAIQCRGRQAVGLISGDWSRGTAGLLYLCEYLSGNRAAVQ